MYYYFDDNHVLQGPYSPSAYTRWFANSYMPPGTQLFDRNHQPCLIEDVARSLKSRAKVMFCDESINMDKTVDVTELDVTLDMSYLNHNDDSVSSDDFTQLEEGVDEVDCGKGSEKDANHTFLQKEVNIYVNSRSRNNQRRCFPDTYVPFEYPWEQWVPHPLNKSDVLRGAIHIQNQIQDYEEQVFSKYLESLNIFPHSCYLCEVSFANSFQMLTHFLSVIHINRTYSLCKHFSMIDIYCVQKMMSEVESIDLSHDFHSNIINLPQMDKELFFDNVDITTAFESMKSTVTLLQTVPLLHPSPRRTSGDSTGYIETILYLRDIEETYNRTPKTLRCRRFGATSHTVCEYCDVDFDATFMDSFAKHLFSEGHIHNTLDKGLLRSEAEHWLSFLKSLLKPAHNHLKNQNSSISLQEGDFPLCYKLVDSIPDDYVYSGEAVEDVLMYVREKLRESRLLLLEDTEYFTSCHWCQAKLHSHNSVLRHVLYDKCHRNHLTGVSNDDLRRLFRWLNIPITIPLFRESFNTLSKTSQNYADEKEFNIQRLKNVFCRFHRRRSLGQVAARNFPLGLVNRCDLCDVNIEHVDEILIHFCSTKHTENLVNNPRISMADIDCWKDVFNVRSYTN